MFTKVAKERLISCFSGSDFRQAHQQAREVLKDLASDSEILRSLVKSYVCADSFRESRRINPVVAIPICEGEHFTLVANIWIPRPDGRTDISHQSIHHHGNLLLTSISAYGPGYESILFRRSEGSESGLEIQQIYINEPGKIEFVDSSVPHIVFYPSSLSVTYALWSKDRPYSLSKLRALPPTWKKAARKTLGIFGLSRGLGFNQEQGFDFTVRNKKITPLAERAMYQAGSRQSLLAALRFIAEEIGITDPEVWAAIGGKDSSPAPLFDAYHSFVPDANLFKEEVLACFR